MITKHVFAITVLTFLIGAQAFAGTPACVLPVADGGDIVPSPASLQGEIANVTDGQITLKGQQNRPIRFGGETQLFTVYGGIVYANELKTGQHVFVWLVGCKETHETPPMAAVIQLCSKAAEPCPK